MVNSDLRGHVSCKRCGGQMVYKGVGEYKCDVCGYVDYDDYGIVRNYIEKNTGATVVEISVATGVSQTAINRMLKEERLQVATDSRVFLKCIACGKDILSGQYCPECARLAKAAAIRKKAKQARQSRNLIGYENNNKGESGAIRFRRDED